MTFLTLSHVRKEFGKAVAVRSFDLSIDRGEFVAFLGPSGCGKTTVLRMIAGFEQPTSGTIELQGKDITRVPANRRNIGMVFQQYALFPNMTVTDNICFGLKVAGASRTDMNQRAAEMLDIIGMKEFGSRFPSQLSGGQQQRVALARALAIRPQVLLLDEPLSALDAKIRMSLRQEIRSIQRQLGITTIFVTHDQEEALSIADRIVVMNRGLVEQVGSPRDIYNQPETQFVASFIGTLNVMKAAVADKAGGKVALDGQHIQTADSLEGLDGSVSIALRPESIALNPELNGGNHLTATVDEIYFLGSVVRVRTRLQEQYLNVDTFNNPGLVLPARGESVTLGFTPSAVKVLQDHAGV
ncbi:MAG: ABC transporter ATP-binding protein [Chloroflexota bacterium]|nr:ABC transporter ATP-binding protein [Chloroflexota bacterium]